MNFCLGTCAKIDQVDLVRRAEQLGVTHFGVGEGPLLFSDPYQYLALAAEATSTIRLGTMVTNPLTRIAPVTANSIATLNMLAPDRTFLGIGTANNAMRSMGRRTATIAELTDAIRVIKGLLRGERVSHQWLGEDRDVQFLDTESGFYRVDHDVPVWVAAGGPKSIAAGARYADAITYCLGPDEALIKLVRRLLDEAVARAGRPPGSVKLIAVTWFYCLRNGETWQDAVHGGLGSSPIVSSLTNLPLLQRHADELGADIVEACTKAATAYLMDPNETAPTHYLDTWAKYLRGLDPAHAALITEQLCDYWCLYGSPDDLKEKAALMHEAGVDMINVFVANPFTVARDLHDLGRTILA